MFIEDSAIMENPDLYEPLIYEMRIFSLLATTSSAYPEVRAVSKDTDDPSIPSLTIRVFVIGTTLSAIGCVINAVFGLRFPGVGISAGMVQLVSCECVCGKADRRSSRCRMGKGYAKVEHLRRVSQPWCKCCRRSH